MIFDESSKNSDELGQKLYELFDANETGQYILNWLYYTFKTRPTVPIQTESNSTNHYDGNRLAFLAGQEDVINRICISIDNYKKNILNKPKGEEYE